MKKSVVTPRNLQILYGFLDFVFRSTSEKSRSPAMQAQHGAVSETTVRVRDKPLVAICIFLRSIARNLAE